MKHSQYLLIAFLCIPLFAQDDTTPPELTYFSFTPDTVDVTDSSAVIDLTASAVDDMSGIHYVSDLSERGFESLSLRTILLSENP